MIPNVNDLICTTPDDLLGLSLNDLNIRPQIRLQDKTIDIKLEANYPIGFLHQSLGPVLRALLPDYQLNLSIHQSIRPHQTQLPGRALRGVSNVIAIASGKGGVGKSTLSVKLATALGRLGARVGLLDADIYGPSLPMMLGVNAQPQLQGDHYLPIRVHGIDSMSIGYLTQGEQALIWRGPMLAKSLIHLLDTTLWADLDYLIVDLPPGTGDIQLSLVQKIPMAGAVIVTTPQQIATLDADKALQLFAKTQINSLGIIENMSSHRCSLCGHQELIFGHGGADELAKRYETPLLGQLALDSRIREACDQGQPSSLSSEKAIAQPFLSIALNVAKVLAQNPLSYSDKFPPIIKA